MSVEWTDPESLLKFGEESFKTGMEYKEKAESAYETASKYAEELGLIPPKGKEKGGRWVTVIKTGEKQWYDPDQHLFGKPVSSYPTWFTLSDWNNPMTILPRISELGGGESMCEQIASMDPISGLAAEGTPISALTDEAKGQYLTNANVIAACKQRMNPVALSGYTPSLIERSKELGVYGQSPLSVTNLKLATDRLFALAKGLVGARGELPMAADGETGGGWQSCFNAGLSPQDRATCISQHQGDPGMAESLDVIYNPWKAVADPDKSVQLVEGIDGNKYVVVKAGDKPRGFRLEFVITAGSLITMGLVSSLGTWYFLNHTVKGKKVKTALFGSSKRKK